MSNYQLAGADPRPFLRVSEVASLLGVGSARVYQLARAGEIPSVVVGGRLVVPREAWASFCRKRVQEANARVEPATA